MGRKLFCLVALLALSQCVPGAGGGSSSASNAPGDDSQVSQNSVPSVNAGSDQTVTLPSAATLEGSVTDDGLPNPPSTLVLSWSKLSGAGSVDFADDSALQTTAGFLVSGVYVLRLTADDGALQTSDDIQITVNPAAANNQAPAANGGSGSTLANTAKALTLSGSDPENDDLSFIALSNPAHGALGSITKTSKNTASALYTPSNNYTGPDSFTFKVSDGHSDSNTATVSIMISATQGNWTPPIGIPYPSFGINESHTMYTGLAGYSDEGNGPYTHYIDNTHSASTDSNNAKGTPSKPRKTIPTNLAAGSVVEIHGGPYTYGNHNGQYGVDISGMGTASQPIFIRGIGTNNKPKFSKPLEINARYLILEYIDSDKNAGASDHPGGIAVEGTSSFVAVRHCEVQNRVGGPNTALLVSGNPVHDVVIYDCKVHDIGNWQATTDEDHRGIGALDDCYNVWIVDNEVWHTSADGIGIGGNNSPNDAIHHIYMGRNICHENKQGGIWAKQSRDIIASQNVISGHRPSDSSTGHGMGGQYSPQRVWFLFNEIYNNERGIFSPGIDDFYIVGNVIRDIHHTNSSYNVTNPYEQYGEAINLRSCGNTFILNNTIYDTDSGIVGTSNDAIEILNNIFSSKAEPNARHILLATVASSSVVRNNLFDGTVRISWNDTNTVQNLSAFQSSNSSIASSNLNANPNFVNVGQINFRLQSSSPAVNVGMASTVYTTFQNLYGVSIAVDFEGTARPQGSGWDMGAYEYH